MAAADVSLLHAAKSDPYLREYIEELKKATTILPIYYENITVKELSNIRKNATTDPTSANVIYKISNGHIHIDALRSKYTSIEHKLDPEEKDKLRKIKESILAKAAKEDSVGTKEDMVRVLEKLFDQSVEIVQGKTKPGKRGGKVQVTQREYEALKYYINRDIIGYGPIEPLILDPYIEDVHLIGTAKVTGIPQGLPVWPGDEHPVRRRGLPERVLRLHL